MNENQIESAAIAIFNSLFDEIEVDHQLQIALKKYPLEFREDIEYTFYEYFEEAKSCIG